MSIESAKLFNKRIETDEEFAKKVIACKDAQERKTLIHKAGFDFTASELMEAGMVLSDDDLDDIAAGGTKNFKPQMNVSFG